MFILNYAYCFITILGYTNHIIHIINNLLFNCILFLFTEQGYL